MVKFFEVIKKHVGVVQTKVARGVMPIRRGGEVGGLLDPAVGAGCAVRRAARSQCQVKVQLVRVSVRAKTTVAVPAV